MESLLKVLITFHFIFLCNGVSLLEQLEHISRRLHTNLDPLSVILGAPSMANHLPEAEPIMPGHTLLRPARGMLKSSIKFPHRELEYGAGVYGNVNNLGIRYDGKHERVMYSGFRRTADANDNLERTQQYDIDNLDNGGTARRELTPLGFVVVEAPEEEFVDVVKLSLENTASQEPIQEEERNSNQKIDKREWFKNSKDLFNHIKIKPSAPEQTELMPINFDNDTKHWWFYHQEDFVPFNAII